MSVCLSVCLGMFASLEMFERAVVLYEVRSTEILMWSVLRNLPPHQLRTHLIQSWQILYVRKYSVVPDVPVAPVTTVQFLLGEGGRGGVRGGVD